MKIVLLFPPAGNPSQPYISLPSLTAFMRRAGHTVIQRDIAVEAIDDLINARCLHQSMDKISARLAHLMAQPELSPRETAEYYQLGRVNTFAPYAVDHIEEAKRLLRDPTQILTRHTWALRTVELGLELFSAEYWPSVWDTANFAMPDYGINIGDVLVAGCDKEKNIFFDYFDKKIVPSVLAEEPKVIGISCTFFGQILATFSLAQLLKKNHPELHVCLGGAVIAHLAPVLQREPGVFSIVDSIVVGEGEHALLHLAEALSNDGDLSQVPNLMYFDGNQVCTTDLYVEDVNTLPTPDYEGLPLESYLTPEINALLATDRGCYWHRCAFCVISTGMHHRYRPRRISLVIEDMKKLHQQLGTRCFFLSNDAIPPKRMKALAQAIKEEGLNFHWQTETRLEKTMTPETCRLLAEGGCRRLMVGIESGSQRILNLMDKGTRAADLPRLLWNCHNAGIAMHIFLMLGFPTETREEARETMAFVEDNYETITSLTLQAFSLYPGSKVYANPEAYGMAEWKHLDPRCLDRTVQDFRVSSGMNQEEIMNQALPEAYRRFARLFPAARLTNKVVSACRFPAFDDFDRSYLAWVAHHGVKHYHEVPAMMTASLTPLEPSDISDMTLEFADGVWWRNGNGLALTLFNPQNARLLSLPPQAEELLKHYDGQSTVQQIADRLTANEQGSDYLKRYYQAVQLSKRLVEEGFLTAVAHEGKAG